jgi:hypothetical protein
MRVSEIKTDAKEVLGYCEDDTLYGRLTQAVEVLSKEGNWDSLQAYIDIVVDDRVVTLPRDVLIPLEININNHPAFSRSKLYEFTMNGPGSDMQDTLGYSWMDKGTVPVMKQPNGMQIAASGINVADAGLTIKLWGYDQSGRECYDAIVIGGTDPAQLTPSVNTFQIITQVSKPVTAGRVDLYGIKTNRPPGIFPPPPPGPPPPPVQCADPTIVPNGGTFPGRVAVAINDNEPGAKMSITLDGSIPTPDHGQIVDSRRFAYSPPFGDTTVSVLAFKDGLANSDVVTAVFHIVTPDHSPGPSFNPIGGTYQLPVLVAINAPGADHLAYTIDDPIPPSPTHGIQSPRNFTHVRINSGTHTLRAMSYTAGRQNSAVTVATYIIVHGRTFGLPFEDLGENPLFDSGTGNPPPVGNEIPVPNPPTPFPPVPQPPILDGGPDFLIFLTSYYADETEPAYRQILLNAVVPGTNIAPRGIRMLYRRRTYAITSDDDWIPLNSHMAILTALRALESLRNGTTEELQKVDPLLKQAVDFLQKDQKVLDMFDLAAQSEIPPTLDLNYVTADSLVVADIFDDACQIFGPIGRNQIYDKITAAAEILNNQGQWDGLIGYVDLLTDSHHYITLPRYVEAPIAININGTPRMMRNKWFEFHLNGPGSHNMGALRYWDDMADVVTIRPIPWPSKLVARCDLASDNGKIIKVFGYDAYDTELRTQAGDVAPEDGLTIPMSTDGVLIDAQPLVARIERITKQQTNGYCQLMAWEPQTKTAVPIGFYHPDELEPNYHRVRLPHKCAWVRMKYRKRQIKVSGLTDPLHLRSKMAIVTAMKSIKALDTDPGLAETLEKKAIDYLDKEQSSRNPSETFNIQFEGLETEVII